MTDLDDLPFTHDDGRIPNGAKGRPAGRNPNPDPVAVRRGRSSLRAGKDAERAVAKAYGGKRTGQYGGPDDVVVGNLLVIQSKAGVSWFSERFWQELQKLPRTGGRIPTLVVSDRPGPGRRTRRLSIRLLEDDVALLGNEADPARRALLDEGSEE